MNITEKKNIFNFPDAKIEIASE